MRIPSLLRQVIAVGLVLFFSTACIGPFKRTPRAMQGLAKSYIVLQGKLASAPQIKEGGDLLEIYLGVGERSTAPEAKLTDVDTGEEVAMPEAVIGLDVRFESIKYCIAFNKEEKKRLENALGLMTASVSADKPVFLYVKLIEGRKYMWFYDGLDCVVFAVGVWHPQAQKYVTLDTAYGLTWYDGISFRSVIQTLIKKGGKTAVGLVTP